MTDIINEYFGVKQVRFLSILTAVLIGFAFLVVWLALKLQPSDFWLTQTIDGQNVNMKLAFQAIFGQGMWTVSYTHLDVYKRQT